MAVTPHKTSPKAPVQPTQKETPFLELTLEGNEEYIEDVAFIPGTRLLVTGFADGSLRVWDLDTGKQVGEALLGHNSKIGRVTASHDGCWIVSGGRKGSILVWEVATNKTVTEFKKVPVSFKGHGNAVWDVVFAPDNETFASASWDKTVCVWKRETGKIVLGPFKVASGAHSLSYSPDGTKLAAGTGTHIIVWNAKTGEELLKIKQWGWRIAFTPDGLRLVSGNNRDIQVSDATTGDIIKLFDAHTEPFYALAIAPSGTKFVTTSSDKTMRFFDLDTFEPIGEPLEHPEVVFRVAFSEDSQFIATGCEDRLVRTWTVPLTKSEKESQQKILKKTIPSPQPRPRHAPIPTTRFFDDFDPHSPHGRNNRTATATRHAEGSGIKIMMDRLFSRSSAPQGHAPRPRRIALVDVFATRGKYRTANAHSGKRHKLPQLQHPPRKQAHAGTSSSSTPPTGTSNAVDEITPATLQIGSANASVTTNHPSPLDVEHVSNTSCFAVLTRCFPCLSRPRLISPAPPRTS